MPIPSGVTEIGDFAFFYSGIAGLDLTGADSLTRIGTRAFGMCTNWTGTVRIPAAVAEIGDYSFSNSGITGLDLSGADSLTGSARCKTEGDKKTVVRQVQLCYDTKSSKPDAFVPLFYEAAAAQTITANRLNVQALLHTVNKERDGAEENGITLELTALGVGAKTIGGKTYVAIGFELTRTAAQ